MEAFPLWLTSLQSSRRSQITCSTPDIHNARSITQGFGRALWTSTQDSLLIAAAPIARKSNTLRPIRLPPPHLHHSNRCPPRYIPPNGSHTQPTDKFPADLVQDMYLRELKGYKAPAVKASDAQGHVQTFTMPKAPASPEEADIASELKAYEDQTVEVEGQAGAGEAQPVEQDWFEEEPEEEEAHGH